MTDIRLLEKFSLEAVTMDWLMTDAGTLDEREELATAARVALGTDAMADVREVLPDPDSTDRKGWWGDYEADIVWGGWNVGCKNWLLSRAKITEAPSLEGSTLERARRYTQQALQPFIDKRIASQVVVDVARTQFDRIEVKASIYRGPTEEIELRYQIMWKEEEIYDVPPVAITSDNMLRRIPYPDLALSATAPVLTRTYHLNIVVPCQDLVMTPNNPVEDIAG